MIIVNKSVRNEDVQKHPLLSGRSRDHFNSSLH